MYLLGVTKTKRKRKLIIDEVKNISGEEMKNQLSDTTDIGETRFHWLVSRFENIIFSISYVPRFGSAN